MLKCRRPHEALPVVFENAVSGHKSTLTLKGGAGFYVGQAHAKIALADDDASPPLTVTIELPAHAVAQATNDSKTLKISEYCPALGLSSIDFITFQVEQILTAALTSDRLRINDPNAQPAYSWRIFLNVSCLTLDTNLMDMSLLCALGTLLLLQFPALTFDADRRWWRHEAGAQVAFVGMDCLNKLPISITCTHEVESGDTFIDAGFGDGPARAVAAVCHHYEVGSFTAMDCRSMLRLPSPSNVVANTFAFEFAKMAAITQKSADERMQALIKAYHATVN